MGTRFRVGIPENVGSRAKCINTDSSFGLQGFRAAELWKLWLKDSEVWC